LKEEKRKKEKKMFEQRWSRETKKVMFKMARLKIKWVEAA